MKLQIRNTQKYDYRIVEEITRKAFWNLHIPGCDEHFLAYNLRKHPDYIPELDFVAVLDREVIGNIMYSTSYLLNHDNHKLATITFGPVSILPDYQRKGFGSEMISYSIEAAKQNGHSAIIIYGNPNEYCKFGFKGSRSFNIATPEGKYPCGLLVKELKDNMLSNDNWRYFESEVYSSNLDGFEEYEESFEKMEKKYQYTQELFSILSNAYIEE